VVKDVAVKGDVVRDAGAGFVCDLAAAAIEDPRGVIDHKLYWATAHSEIEADFLCAILNSAAVTQLVRPLMSYGKEERDIDKHVWDLPIPEYDHSDADHVELAKLAKRARQEIAELELNEKKHFAALRRSVRKHLAQSETGRAIEQRVVQRLPNLPVLHMLAVAAISAGRKPITGIV